MGVIFITLTNALLIIIQESLSKDNSRKLPEIKVTWYYVALTQAQLSVSK